MFGKLIFFLLIALGISMAIPSTRTRLMEVAAPYLDKAKAKLVPSRLEAMADQLQSRVSRGEGYPAAWESWLRRDYSGVPEDPWGNLYYLKTDRTGFTVGSDGPDGVPHTDDDIVVRRRLGR